MEELKIIVNQELGVISTNFDEIRENLTAQMEVYNQLEVTEANKTDRKKDISTLRKISKSVNEKRIEVKNECLKPYQVFEEKAKELIEIINQPIFILDNQVKEFEEKQRLIKIDDIDHIYSDLIGDLIEFVSLDMIYDAKWENVSVSMKSIKDELSTRIASIKQDVTVISSMVSDKTAEALDGYWNDLNLAKAITSINQYEQQQREFKERHERQLKEKAEREAEQQRLQHEKELQAEKNRIKQEAYDEIERENKIKEDERNRVMAEQRAKEQAEIEAMAAQKQESGTIYATYTFEATENELKQIEMYCSSIGVDFERVI